MVPHLQDHPQERRIGRVPVLALPEMHAAAFTLTVYGHIFDADLDDLAARLEILGRDSDGMPVKRLRPPASG